MNNGFAKQYEKLRGECERALEAAIPDGVPEKLQKSMRYSLLGGGKRLRPALYLAVIRSYGKEPTDEDRRTAAAIECIHSYSLVHDDLPAMDNDDLRRGRPSNHKAFGEATALLAGDALLNLAFELLAGCACADARYARIMKLIAERSGALGMIAGQAIEFDTDLAVAGESEFSGIARLKTGKLIEAAVLGGCIAARKESEIGAWTEYSENFGRAFQLRDDMLDVGGGERSLAAVLGDGAEAELEALCRAALSALEKTGGDTEFLRGLTKSVLLRSSDGL